jgi:hypothetical protein
VNALLEAFPLQLRGVEIDLVDPEHDAPPPRAKPGERWLTIRVIRYDHEGLISDIMEQSVCVARTPEVLEHAERVRNCMAAHRELLGDLFEKRREEAMLLPMELLYIGELLALERAFSVDDFARALLAKKRLGSLLRRS